MNKTLYRIAALAGITIGSMITAASANNVHSISEYTDKKETFRPTYFKLEPVKAKTIKKAHKHKKISKDDSRFPGHGHRLGGDPYVSRLLGIDHKEGKKLHKLAMKAEKRKTKSYRKKSRSKDAARTKGRKMSGSYIRVSDGYKSK